MVSKMDHGSRTIRKLNRFLKKDALVLKKIFSSIKSKKQESISRRRDDIGENTCDVRRSEPVPSERWRHMSGFLPWAPLAWTLGAEESLYIYIYVHIWEDLIIYAAEETRLHTHNGCLHTGNEHTLVQSTLIQLYTSYTGALAYTTTLHEPTNTIPCTSLRYNLHYSTTTTTHHILWSTLRNGPAPSHMLNEHVVGQWGCYLLVIEYHVLRHLLAIILGLKMFGASCRGKEY